MKLRYYLRGLGIGILMTVVILTIAGLGKDTMTDEEIKDRAKELGMVESTVLSGMHTPNPGEGTEETTEPKPSDMPKETDVSNPTEEPEEEATSAPEGEIVTIVIAAGDSSVSVSKDLEAAGLVESASAYDKYLCDNGYDRRIRTGTHQIPAGASEEEIARIITGRK